MIERFRGRPFVLLGMNDDGPREEVAPELTKNDITWRNVIDGSPGRIGSEWNVSVQPTLYVIDAKGVIRERGDIYEDRLDAIVLTLLEEAEAARAKGE